MAAKILGKDKKSKIRALWKLGLKTGKNFQMMEQCIIDPSHCWHITIGDDVTLAPRVHILAHDASTKNSLGYSKIKNVSIGNKVFVGADSLILPGVRVGNNVIIGAGSVVTKDVPDNSVVAGNPARFISTTDAYLSAQAEKKTEINTFGEEYSLRKKVSDSKKEEMKQIVQKYGIGFAE